MAGGFLIGDQFLGRIRSAVDAHEGYIRKEGPYRIERRFEGEQPNGGSGSAIKVCVFTGAWPIGGAKTCTVKNSTEEIEVTNLFHQIGADCGERDAAIANVSGIGWILLVARCG